MSFFLSGIGNLQVLLENCLQRERDYFSQPDGHRRCADPFVFARAALIYRKRQDAGGERSICERWDLIYKDFERQARAAEMTGRDNGLSQQLHNRKQQLERRDADTASVSKTPGQVGRKLLTEK